LDDEKKEAVAAIILESLRNIHWSELRPTNRIFERL